MTINSGFSSGSILLFLFAVLLLVSWSGRQYDAYAQIDVADHVPATFHGATTVEESFSYSDRDDELWSVETTLNGERIVSKDDENEFCGVFAEGTMPTTTTTTVATETESYTVVKQQEVDETTIDASEQPSTIPISVESLLQPEEKSEEQEQEDQSASPRPARLYHPGIAFPSLEDVRIEQCDVFRRYGGNWIPDAFITNAWCVCDHMPVADKKIACVYDRLEKRMHSTLDSLPFKEYMKEHKERLKEILAGQPSEEAARQAQATYDTTVLKNFAPYIHTVYQQVYKECECSAGPSPLETFRKATVAVMCSTNHTMPTSERSALDTGAILELIETIGRCNGVKGLF